MGASYPPAGARLGTWASGAAIQDARAISGFENKYCWLYILYIIFFMRSHRTLSPRVYDTNAQHHQCLNPALPTGSLAYS